MTVDSVNLLTNVENNTLRVSVLSKIVTKCVNQDIRNLVETKKNVNSLFDEISFNTIQHVLSFFMYYKAKLNANLTN